MPRSKHTAKEKLALIREFEQSEIPRETFARQHCIDGTTLHRWIGLYKRDGIDGLEEAKKNNHYSEVYKLMVIQVYLNGEGTHEELAIRFDLRNKTQVQNWVDRYNRDKTVTASPFRKQVPTMSRKTTFEERITVVEYVTRDKHSLAEAAEHFQVSYQQARSWVIKARDGGYEALVDNRGHHKQEHELTENERLKLRIRQLEAQLKDKELLEAFTKKFLELQRKG